MRELHDIHHKKGQGRARPNPLRNPPTHILGMGFGPRPAKLGGGGAVRIVLSKRQTCPVLPQPMGARSWGHWT